MITYTMISNYEKIVENFLLLTNSYYCLAYEGLTPPELNGIFNYISAYIFSESCFRKILNNENLYLYLTEWVKINCTDLNSFVNNNFEKNMRTEIFCFLNEIKNGCSMDVFKNFPISGQSLKALIDCIKHNKT